MDSESRDSMFEESRDSMFEDESNVMDTSQDNNKDIQSEETPPPATHNPWSLRCHKEQLAKMRRNTKSQGVHSILFKNKCRYKR